MAPTCGKLQYHSKDTIKKTDENLQDPANIVVSSFCLEATLFLMLNNFLILSDFSSVSIVIMCKRKTWKGYITKRIG
jgi:hypothetical protein